MSEAINLLRELAGKLGQTVEYLFPELVRYEAMMALFTIVGWFLAVVLAGTIALVFCKQGWVEGDPGNQYITGKTIASIFTVVFTLVFFIVLAHNVPVVLSPTGYVVAKILKVRR